MFSKRLRNKKLEQNRQYQVFYISDLNPYDIVDYQQQNIKTGIEQDEEKEMHLKEVLTGGRKEILVPGIVSVQPHKKESEKNSNESLKSENIANESHSNILEEKEYKRPDKMIHYNKDCPNEINLSDEDKKIILENHIEENVLLGTIREITKKGEEDTHNEEIERVKSIIERHFSHKLLRINENGTMGCFRRLTTHMIRKNRRSEASISEKLKRVWTEMSELENLLQLKNEQNRINQSLLEINKEIGALYAEITALEKHDRKRVFRIVFSEEKSKSQPFYQTVDFDELLNSRRKQSELKRILQPKKSTVKPSEVEVMSKVARFLK